MSNEQFATVSDALPANSYSSGPIMVNGVTYTPGTGVGTEGSSFQSIGTRNVSDSWSGLDIYPDDTTYPELHRRSATLTAAGIADIDANYMFSRIPVVHPVTLTTSPSRVQNPIKTLNTVVNAFRGTGSSSFSKGSLGDPAAEIGQELPILNQALASPNYNYNYSSSGSSSFGSGTSTSSSFSTSDGASSEDGASASSSQENISSYKRKRNHG